MKNKRNKISMSTACAYSPRDGHRFDFAIKLLSKLEMDGIELAFNNPAQIEEFDENKYKKYFKNLTCSTFHFPTKDRDGQLIKIGKKHKRLLSKIYKICSVLNISNLVIHSYNIGAPSVFDTTNFIHHIEVMEKKWNLKPKYYLDFIKKNPSWKIVLDSSHMQQCGNLVECFKKLNTYTGFYHISVCKYENQHLPLHIINKDMLSDLKIFTNKPMVLEGWIGTDDIEDYKNEVSFARKNL